MFNTQISLLSNFIEDWDNVVQGSPKYPWSLSLGLCSNCRLGFRTLMDVHGYSYSEVKGFLGELWKDFPGYTGDIYHPLCTKGEYLLMDNFTQHPQRLELAKHCLQFLKDKSNGSEEF